jgi:hypothetical protein
MKRHASRVAAVAVAALTGWIGLATPASATVHTFDTEAVSAELIGLFRERDIPHEGNPSLCPGSSTFSGEIDDSTTTDNITGSLTWTGDSIDLFTVTDVFQEVYTGTSTGNAAGNFDPATGRFRHMRFPDMSVSVYRLDFETCARIETLCTYEIDGFKARGRLRGGATFPLATGDQIGLEAEGDLVVDALCPPVIDPDPPPPLPITVPVTIGPNPNDPAGYNRAIYQQV